MSRQPEARVWGDELVVDSFAGGGGASLGISWALGRGPDIAINHDAEAIALHRANHPETHHYAEDVWKVDPVVACGGRPVGLMWLSPDCKHFSKAKGGKPVSKKIRGLAWVAVRWAAAVRPRVLVLENVEEFQTWGPVLADTMKPCPQRKGKTFRAFIARLRRLGYAVEWRELRACDYGTPTIRKRLFIIARCDGQPIVWPKPTHGKGLVPWRIAAECIQWEISCPSIFERKKALAENTLKRIARGLKKFVIESPRPFIVNMANGGNVEPLGTLVSGTKHALVSAFLAKHYTTDADSASLFEPVPTVTSIDHNALTVAHISQLNGTSTGQSPFDPLNAIAAQGLHFADVRAFLVAYYGNEKDGGDLFDPARTITSKDRYGLVTVEGVEYQIADIGMRMLQPRELYRAQGFPDSYRIDIEYRGKPLNKTAQVRMVGNSVCPPLARAIVAANYVPAKASEAAA